MELSQSESKNLVPGGQSAIAENQDTSPVLRAWMQMPRGRQIALIAVIAFALAVAIAMLLWANRTEYVRLYSNLEEKEAGEIVEALQKLNIEHEIDPTTGVILVPAGQVHAVRLKLAGMGLPRESGAGFEILEKQSGFGTSQMMEGARYQRALEGEIARSIATIRNVKSARVHLALPKESVFVRRPKKPSASVIVELHSGRGLEPGQVEAIVHLVASSVPQLEPGQVTVVDQRGHLLNAKDDGNELYLNAKQFDYKKQVEEHLIERIENILAPVVGRDGIRTQVTADIDFTVTERTQEVYNPDLPALRSEQTSEEQTKGSAVQGVPGALSNQPPPAGIAPETTAATPNDQAGQKPPELPLSTSKSATRNYELDKTISHSRLATGVIRRITAAVVVDYRHVPQGENGTTLQPYSEEDLNRFTRLVQEAVGYDASRGDRVTVTNAPFRTETEDSQALPMWEQDWFWSLVKQAGAVLVVLALVLGVLRPAVKGLIGRGDSAVDGNDAAEPGTQDRAVVEPREISKESGDDELLMLEAPESHEKRVAFAQRAVDQDPKRVAQVIKNWINANG
ncbi:flagellar basal-body MS-ring/collar protein FliF [Methylocaldum szegediense]|uniref:Flagellar M-ring protein n=1 Tax=Methylocaldum szegediense TaxID=73780 RepID=A0ABN8X3H6_9GAMM|nr:flagellar basal-body MS-ring/collar protein FliF [Methylocaldum szegediense]CAI8754558.1 flagellar basal-body MS-ring and collar protein [Methylocaldum szegediense]